MCSVARVVLEKFIESSVAIAKLFKMVLREEAAAGDAAAIISVSSAYCSVVGGRLEKMGW